MNAPASLPSYKTPPVVEVLASVQFEPIAGLNFVAFGRLWERFRSRFPNVEQQSRLPTQIERLGIRAPLNTLQLQFATDATAPRLWFVSVDGTELVQLQSDRFIRNWRYMPAANNLYPRYERHVKPEFLKDFRAFIEFCEEEKLESVAVNQCEITYINHIYPNEHWTTHKDVAQIFEGWAGTTASPLGLEVEALNSRVAYTLLDDDAKFLGRLHVTIQSAFGSPQEVDGQDLPLFALTMTVRGHPLGDRIDDVVSFLDRGRVAIVQTFDKMTTAKMHEAWGKVT